MAVMSASTFIKKLVDIAENYKTLYVMGCFGAPLNAANKERYCNNHSYNKQASRTAMIKAASADTFGFDCVCLIKGVLWGWSGDKSKSYGGASYAINGVPDIGADTMITKCSQVSTSNWANMVPGEALWTTGHIGVYIGNGLAVECTPSFKNNVQITAVQNIGAKAGYPSRTWKKHGRLPYISYDVSADTSPVTPSNPSTPSTPSKPSSTKVEAAHKFDRSLAGTYTVTASSGLRLRTGAGTNKTVLRTMPKGTKVNNYGYYNLVGSTKWLYVKLADGTLGYCSMEYLTK